MIRRYSPFSSRAMIASVACCRPSGVSSQTSSRVSGSSTRRNPSGASSGAGILRTSSRSSSIGLTTNRSAASCKGVGQKVNPEFAGGSDDE